MINVIFDKTYAGIGSRKLNKQRSKILITFAFVRALNGWKVASGGADGSDTAFEVGARLAYRLLNKINPEQYPKNNYNIVQKIYIPWNNFNGRKNSEYGGYSSKISPAEYELAIKYHPSGEGMKDSIKNLMARNVLQILGEVQNESRTPVNEVICYTPDGAETKTTYKTGGTGQSIRIANDNNIAVHNLGSDNGLAYIEEVISQGVDWWDFNMTPSEYVSEYIKQFNGFENSVKGNILKTGKADVIIHGCNCFINMGGGVAKAISNKWPEVLEVDKLTKKGDKTKLGSFTKADVVLDNGKKATVLNLYTQFEPSGSDELVADYEAIRKGLKEVNKQYKGKNIVFPKIGAESANGDWFTISTIIRTELKNCNLMLVDFQLVDSFEVENLLLKS
jgi:O-acetyl-ADP-ribose deacetylase (regulator of RNase III)